mmetsp:Transcript_1313/g.2624  ORF Transcript_1313/g.2624 Transcript_1313/m.2624 type:complete len:178 (-) Transcript_1313:344-877(-)
MYLCEFVTEWSNDLVCTYISVSYELLAERSTSMILKNNFYESLCRNSRQWFNSRYTIQPLQHCRNFRMKPISLLCPSSHAFEELWRIIPNILSQLPYETIRIMVLLIKSKISSTADSGKRDSEGINATASSTIVSVATRFINAATSKPCNSITLPSSVSFRNVVRAPCKLSSSSTSS